MKIIGLTALVFRYGAAACSASWPGAAASAESAAIGTASGGTAMIFAEFATSAAAAAIGYC